jgi:hypothetical protein
MLLLVCLLSLVMQAVSQHSNNICKAVLSVTEQLNAAKRSFIFRCRPGDDCGGIGDRLGGVMGGAFYALQTGRSFRILWPGLDHVFKPGYSNWTFDAVTLNVPYEDASGHEMDKTRITDVNGNQVIEPFTDRKDVLVVNDLNSRQITNATRSAMIDSYQHVFFHSNRGPTRDMYSAIHKKYNWATSFPDTDESYAAVYHCVFEGLFRPTEEFLSSEYASISRATVPFTHIIRVIEDPKYTSMAFHHRVDDSTAAANAANEVIDATHLAKIIELSQKHAQRQGGDGRRRDSKGVSRGVLPGTEGHDSRKHGHRQRRAGEQRGGAVDAAGDAGLVGDAPRGCADLPYEWVQQERCPAGPHVAGPVRGRRVCVPGELLVNVRESFLLMCPFHTDCAFQVRW